jgi:hypothetical protein
MRSEKTEPKWPRLMPGKRCLPVAQICNLLYRGVELRQAFVGSKRAGLGDGRAECNSAIRQFTKLRYKGISRSTVAHAGAWPSNGFFFTLA